MERKRSVQDEEGPSTSTAEVAANRYIQRNQRDKMGRKPQCIDAAVASTYTEPAEQLPQCPRESQDGDCVMDRQYEELHAKIQEGDIKSVERLVQDVKPGLPLCFDGISALKRSFSCKQVHISTFLISFGLIFKDDGEGEDLEISEEDVDLINIRLWYFNRDLGESCIYKLMFQSTLPLQGDKNSNNALLRMYKELFDSECIKYLMKVLEKEQPHIVYDFASKNIDRIYFDEATGLSGLTVPSTNTIYIGAEELLSESAEERAKVKGVVAEEFCHLALKYLFENASKPFKVKEENSDEVKAYLELISSLKSDAENEGDLPPIIKDLFIGGVYESDEFHCELIARVPHLMGINGERKVRETFKSSSKLTQLVKFYDENVIPACKSFTDPLYYSRPMMDLQSLHREKGYILPNEKIDITFRDNENCFEEHLVDNEGIKVLYTNITKLCALRMYHEFKERIVYHVDKVCLFFTLDTFVEIKDDLIQKYKSELIQYLILIVEENIQTEIIEKALDNYIGGCGNPKVIIISLSECENSDGIRYKWNDVPFEFKELFLQKSFYFKGKKFCFKDKVKDLTKVFENDIATFQKLTSSGEPLRLDDGADLFSQHYSRDTYIERNFQAMTVDKNIFKGCQLHNSCIFLSGLEKEKLGELPKEQVQWFDGSHDNILCDKSIFVVNKDAEMSFEDYRTRCLNKKCIWLHYYEEEFHVRNIDSCGDVFGHHIKQKTLSEEETLNFLKRERTVIISDNAGYGKSTVISSLIDNVKTKNCRSWNWRINLSKFSGDEADPLSIANVEENSCDEEVLDHLFLMLGIENGLEKLLFRELSKEGQCFIFFDGFDEIPSEYKDSALKLLSTVRKQTAVNMIISTRKHHQKELEELLNTYSHQLVPLSREDQVKYLDKMWKSKLKYPNGRMASQNDRKKVPERIKNILKQSEDRRTNLDKELNDLITALNEIELRDSLDSIRRKIDDLNFSKLAETVIEKTSLDKETVQFMGIPLHLFMIGAIYFDSNFKVEINSGIYSIYSKFIDVKIRIYVEEKRGILHDGREKKEIIKKRGKDAYRIHIELANQLMDKGKIEIINMSEEDIELCVSLGIAFIKGEQIDFLHHTFAEYFRAESIRKNLKKDEFIGVLFGEEYEVVRRFLLSSLEEKSFENLTKEFFKDLKFLFSVQKRFVEKCGLEFRDYEFNVKFDTIARIVKCLMESFEYSVDQNCLNEFVLALRSELSSFRKWYVIGGCLTVKMIKILFNGNNNVKLEIFCFVKLIKVYSIRNNDLKLMFSVFKYYSNPEEIIELLSECISIENSGEFDSNERENENRKAERLLKVLKCNDSYRHSLLLYAAMNVGIETIPKILEFSKEILGEELLVNEIIGSREYKEAMDDFINYADFNRITGFLKTFHSVFGKEIDIFFYEKLKFSILEKTLEIEMSNEFEVIINLFKECFGMEKLKEVLPSCNNCGNYLIHILAYRNKNLIKNLNIVRNSLVDSEMKQFLMFKNGRSMNIFHLSAVNRNINFGEIIKFCSNYLVKHEIEEMLTICDEDGENVLHLLFRFNSTERIIEYLDVIKNTLDNDELFKKLLKGEDKKKRNIFHFAARNENVNFGEIMKFCNNYLEKHEIEEMLTSCDEDGWNALHYLFRWKSTERIIECLDVIKNTLDTDELFKKLLKGEHKKKRNNFHFAARNENVNFGEIMKFCDNYLEKDEIEEMLFSCDLFGKNVFHLLFDDNSTERIIECLDVIKKTLDNDELFKMLLKGENKCKRNIFHFAAENINGIDISILSSHLCENEIKELLIGRDEYGNTILHLAADQYSRNLLNLLEYSSETLKADEGRFEELILAENENGDTFLHQFVKWYDIYLGEEMVINLMKSLKEKVSDEIFKELLRIRNKRGETFLQVENWKSKEWFREEDLNIRIIECFKINLGESLIEELLNKNENNGKDNDSFFSLISSFSCEPHQ